jgi:hypothetical protein
VATKAESVGSSYSNEKPEKAARSEQHKHQFRPSAIALCVRSVLALVPDVIEPTVDQQKSRRLIPTVPEGDNVSRAHALLSHVQELGLASVYPCFPLGQLGLLCL